MRFVWPLKTPWITRDFYYMSWLYVGGQHMALDFGASEGTPILTIAPGTVTDKGNDYYSGNYIGINHPDGWHSVYRHLMEQSPLGPGSQVTQGKSIGRVGNTGVSTGNHLHFDLWCKDKHSDEAIFKHTWWAHDPELYLGQESIMNITPEERKEIKNSRDAIVKIEAELAALRTITPEEIKEIKNARNKVRDLQVDVKRLQEASSNYTDQQAVKAIWDKLG